MILFITHMHIEFSIYFLFDQSLVCLSLSLPFSPHLWPVFWQRWWKWRRKTENWLNVFHGLSLNRAAPLCRRFIPLDRFIMSHLLSHSLSLYAVSQQLSTLIVWRLYLGLLHLPVHLLSPCLPKEKKILNLLPEHLFPLVFIWSVQRRMNKPESVISL